MRKLSIFLTLKAFTLLETLLVIGILALVISLTVPAIERMQRSLNLANASQMIEGQLHLARQLAISRNIPILVHFGGEALDGAPPTGPRITTVGIARHTQPGESGTYVMLDRPADLPDGMTISADAQWSRLSQLPTAANVPLRAGKSYITRTITFEPSGGTTLSPSSDWYLTLFQDQRSNTPDRDFVTLAIDPLTGRVFRYQP